VSKRSRDRQLAKLAARRAAERHAQQRRRAVIIGVAATIAVVGLALIVLAFRGGGGEAKKKQRAGTSPTPVATQTPTEVGTLKSKPAAAKVACGGKRPATAGKPKPQFDVAPSPSTIDPKKTYTAKIETSCGTIVVKLDALQAPNTVASFVFLADRHYFDGTYFHRIASDIDVIQGGDPTGTGTGGPGYSIPDELTGKDTYPPGTLAMANGGPNTGGSQFFIITGPKGHNLDSAPNYTVFGSIVDGLDVAQRIQQVPIVDPKAAAAGDLSGQRAAQAVYIESVKIVVTKKKAG
jgi:cyclophilin family peptidyl-prolyl cis-trans isomerase